MIALETSRTPRCTCFWCCHSTKIACFETLLTFLVRICSKEELAETAQDIGVTIPVQKSQEARHNLDPGTFFKTRFWGRRPPRHGVAINEALQIIYILEFKRSTDRDEGFLEVEEAEATEQHKSIIGALKAAAPKWGFSQINFVVGNRGSIVESDFYTNLKKLDVQEGKNDKLFADHVTQVCEAHNRVIVSFPPAGAKRCEANHKGIEGEPRAQCARVKS